MLRPREDEWDAWFPLGRPPCWPDDAAGVGDEEEPADRAGVIAAAREQRLEQPGLAVDDATLERVADAVMAPDYMLPGLYLTDEEVHDEVSDEVCEALHDYLEAHPGLSGGWWLGYVDGLRALFVGIVGEAEPHRAALERISDRIVIRPASVSEAELEAIVERIGDAREELSALGIDRTSWGIRPERGVVELDVIAADRERALRLLTERYGPHVRIGDWYPSRHHEDLYGFGTWSSDGLDLEAHYGLAPRSVRDIEPVRCEVVEHADRVVVTVIVRLSCGGLEILPATPRFRALHASARLAAPIGDRAVIDGSTGEPRPSLAELRARRA